MWFHRDYAVPIKRTFSGIFNLPPTTSSGVLLFRVFVKLIYLSLGDCSNKDKSQQNNVLVLKVPFRPGLSEIKCSHTLAD